MNAYATTEQRADDDDRAVALAGRWMTYETTTFRNLSRALDGLPPERSVVEEAEHILSGAGLHRQS